MNLANLHATLSTSAILFLIVSGFWGLAGFLRRQPVTPAYKGILAVGEALLVAIALVGLLLFPDGRLPGPLHLLYGAVSVLALPGVFAFTGGQMGRREALLYALVSWLTVGFIIRAWQTGQVG